MVPLRLQTPTGFYKQLPRVLNHNCRSSFSTSTPRWPRVAPRASRTLRRRDASQQPHPELNQRDIKLGRDSATSRSKTFAAPEPEHEANSEQQNEAAPKPPPPSSPPPSSSPKSPIIKKRSAPPRMKPHKQSLFTSDTIYLGPASPLLVTDPSTRAEHDQLAAAGNFFAHHRSAFLYSAEALRHHARNDHVPEIVILGASNVGKSSFLNALVGQPGAARVSARPGKTTLMNAYGVGPPPSIPRGVFRSGEKPPRHSLVVVDTPGYGFRSQASWGESIVKYLGARKTLRGAVVLLSSEKRLMEQDRWLLRRLAEANTRTLVVLTKADKSGGSWTAACGEMAQLLREELKKMGKSVGNGWREGSGWNPNVYVTCAGMDRVPKLGNGGGMGGVRAAILEMAGFSLEHNEVKKKDETTTYGGPVVSFDDIKWKT